MITRNERGKLSINNLDLGVAMDGFFIMASLRSREETEWLYERLQEYLEQSYEDTIADFEDEDEE